MWWGGRVERLQARLTATELAVDGLKTKLKTIRMEWEDALDRMNRIMGRLNARIRRSEAQEPAPESEGELPAVPQVGLQRTGTHGVLAEMRAKRGVLPR